MKKNLRHLQEYITKHIRDEFEAGETYCKVDIESFFDEIDSHEDIENDIFSLIHFPSYVNDVTLTEDLYIKVTFYAYDVESMSNKRLKRYQSEIEELNREYFESRGL